MSGNYPAQGEKNLARIVQSIQDLFSGRNNAFGEFTLDVSPATTTTVTAPNCSANSSPLLVPMTANAASEFASGNMYVSSISAGEFVITHASSANNDRTFRFFTAG
jgi:hypothetical protein